MKMTGLHMLFGLFFVHADGRAKSAKQLNGAAVASPIFFLPDIYSVTLFLFCIRVPRYS